MADQVTTSLEQAKVLVMQGMAGKAPRINAENQHWEVWDNTTEQWVDTGVDAGPEFPAVTASDNGKIMKVYNGAWTLGEVPNGVRFATYGTTTADELFGSAASHPYLCVYNNRVYYLTSYGEEALPGTSPTQYRRFAEFASFGYAGAFRLTVSQVNHGYTTWNNHTLPSLPYVTAADNGKVLKVVDGVWTAVAE